MRTTWFDLCHFIEGGYPDLPPGGTGDDLSIALCVISAEQTGSAEAAWRILKPAYPFVGNDVRTMITEGHEQTKIFRWS